MTEITKIKSKQKLRLLENHEDIIQMIENNKSYREIAKKYEVSEENVCFFVNRSEYSTRARTALRSASYKLLDQAQEAIESIQDDSTHARVARQRELKNIYLYRAQIKNRKELDFSYREDKQDANQSIIVVPANFSQNKDNSEVIAHKIKTIEIEE